MPGSDTENGKGSDQCDENGSVSHSDDIWDSPDNEDQSIHWNGGYKSEYVNNLSSNRSYVIFACILAIEYCSLEDKKGRRYEI